MQRLYHVLTDPFVQVMNMLAGLLEANDSMSQFDYATNSMRCETKQLEGSIQLSSDHHIPHKTQSCGRGPVPDIIDPLTGKSRKATALERKRYRETGEHRCKKHS